MGNHVRAANSIERQVALAIVAAVTAGVAVASAARAVSARPSDTPGGRTNPGWSTCSAPGARVYGATFGRLLAGLYRAIAMDLKDQIAGRTVRHIVDVGAGPGGLAVALAKEFPEARITTVDVDAEMAALAAARAGREGVDDRVRITIGDVAALPLADRSVDLVTSSFSVHHWPDAQAGFSEVGRVLRPEGRAIIYDLPDWWGRFETHAPRLAEAATAGGFPEVSSSTLRWPRSVAVIHRIQASSWPAAGA